MSSSTTEFVTTINLPPLEASVVSNEAVLVHSYQRGEKDERALVSMDPGAYEISEQHLTRARLSKLKVLAGYVDIVAGDNVQRVVEGETADLPEGTYQLRAEVFSQVMLSQPTGVAAALGGAVMSTPVVIGPPPPPRRDAPFITYILGQYS
jgi:hypothetical protein